MALSKLQRRKRLKKRIRKVVNGTADCPRLSVFRSNKEIYAQLIDDVSGNTLFSASSLKNKAAEKLSGKDKAALIGKEVAEKAIKGGVKQVGFDRNGYLYHGRVQSLAEAAREAGLKF